MAFCRIDVCLFSDRHIAFVRRISSGYLLVADFLLNLVFFVSCGTFWGCNWLSVVCLAFLALWVAVSQCGFGDVCRKRCMSGVWFDTGGWLPA